MREQYAAWAKAGLQESEGSFAVGGSAQQEDAEHGCFDPEREFWGRSSAGGEYWEALGRSVDWSSTSSLEQALLPWLQASRGEEDPEREELLQRLGKLAPELLLGLD